MGDTFKNSYTVTTLLGMVNQFHGIADLSYVDRKNTTINTYRNIFQDELPSGPPKAKYFGIGIKGFYNVDDGVLSQPYYPLATNMELYQSLPFRCVRVSEDLSPTERANYRMRTRLTDPIGDGSDYFAYWFKLIDYTDSVIKVTQVSGTGEEEDYVFDPATHLPPTPSEVTTPDVLETDGVSVNVSINGQCLITGEEVVEAINVLHEGDLRLAKVSEIGIYTGEDQVVTNPWAEGPATYSEAIYSQLAVHRCTNGTDLSDTSAEHLENIVFKNGNLVLL